MEGFCTPQHPLTFRIGGPPLDDATDGLLFTNDFPCGTEVTATELVRTPMSVIAASGDLCLGDTTCPGSRTLITAHVMSLDRDREVGAGPPHLAGCQANVATSELRVKLLITYCGQPGGVLIDSDSALVIPSGPAEIAVVAPAGWIPMGRIPTGASESWTDVTIRVAACQMRGDAFWPKGHLTEYLQFSDATPQGSRVLIRPRRARRLAAAANTMALAATNVSVMYFREPTAGGVPIGFHTFQSGFPLSNEIFGAAPWVVPVSPAGLISASLRWEIE